MYQTSSYLVISSAADNRPHKLGDKLGALSAKFEAQKTRQAGKQTKRKAGRAPNKNLRQLVRQAEIQMRIVSCSP